MYHDVRVDTVSSKEVTFARDDGATVFHLEVCEGDSDLRSVSRRSETEIGQRVYDNNWSLGQLDGQKQGVSVICLDQLL